MLSFTPELNPNANVNSIFNYIHVTKAERKTLVIQFV